MENCWYQLLKDVCSTICCWSAQLTWWKKPILKSPKTVQNAKDWSWPKHKHKMFSATIHLSCHFSALKPPNPTSQFLNKAEVCSGGPWFLQTPNVWGFRLHDFFTTQKKQLWRKEYQRLSLLKWHTFMTRDAFSKHTPSSCPVQYDATFKQTFNFLWFFLQDLQLKIRNPVPTGWVRVPSGVQSDPPLMEIVTGTVLFGHCWASQFEEKTAKPLQSL